ncbi:zf-TFIIB domain-containing protein [Candidatus Cloacimonadota bacterium]
MDCPVCKKEPMIVLELNEIEIDHCLKCKGIWLDAGELELMLGNIEKSTALLEQFLIDKANREMKFKCPICLKKMEKISIGNEAKITIDRCKNGHGLWFDQGELEAVIKQGSLGEDNKVLALLKEMFKEDLK